MAVRFFALSFFARAFPPASPPLRLAAMAGVSGPGESFARSPVAISTISLASWFGSRGRLGLAMAEVSHARRIGDQRAAGPPDSK